MSTIIKVEMFHGKLMALGAVFALLALLCLIFVIFGVLNLNAENSFILWLSLAGFLLFALFAAQCLGIAWRRPVALRLDDDGVSGYFVPHPLSWSEVAHVSTFTDKHGHESLGFALVDGATYRGSLGSMKRLNSHHYDSRYGYDIVVSDRNLRDWDAAGLAEKAEALRQGRA